MIMVHYIMNKFYFPNLSHRQSERSPREENTSFNNKTYTPEHPVCINHILTSRKQKRFSVQQLQIEKKVFDSIQQQEPENQGIQIQDRKTSIVRKHINFKQDEFQNLDQKLLMIENLVRLLEESTAIENEDPYLMTAIVNKKLDVNRVLCTLKDTAKILGNVSKGEILLNKKDENNKKLRQEMANLKTLYSKEKIIWQSNIRELNELRLKYQGLIDDNRLLQNELVAEQAKKDDLHKKVRNLEERLEFAVEKNLNAHKDQLHNTLGCLIKENENLKREVLNKKKEIDRQKEIVGKLNARISALQKKLESLKTKRVISEVESEESQSLKLGETNLNVQLWPQNLDFRKWGMKEEFQNILTDVIEHGPEAFAFQIVISEDKNQKRELAHLISSQYLSYLDFSDRLNNLIPKLLSMFTLQSVTEVMITINRDLKQIIHSENICLWLMEEWTGYLYTYNLHSQLRKILIEKGAFRQVFLTGKIVNQVKDDDVLLYQSLEKGGQDVFASRVLLIPVMNSGMKVCGVLELNKVQEDKTLIDEQYLAMILVRFSAQLIQRIQDTSEILKQFKYADMAYNSFLNLCFLRSKAKFVENVYIFAQKMFCTSQCIFLIYDNSKKVFIKYNEDQTFEEIYGAIGLAGYVILQYYNKLYQIAEHQRSFISPNITKEVHFHSKVDLDTLLPVFCQPILSKISKENKYTTLGILQFAIKKQRKPAEVDHQFPIGAPMISEYENIEAKATRFASYISTAYMLTETQLEY